MKKISVLLLILVLNSCNREENVSENKVTLIGKWSLQKGGITSTLTGKTTIQENPECGKKIHL